MRVLVVDDREDNRYLLCQLLYVIFTGIKEWLVISTDYNVSVF